MLYPLSYEGGELSENVSEMSALMARAQTCSRQWCGGMTGVQLCHRPQCSGWRGGGRRVGHLGRRPPLWLGGTGGGLWGTGQSRDRVALVRGRG
ncbi:hypothetical protein TUSST3_81140 [Streptomyces sp. TUS-ST3]|nr:hypothetical protein TUSST3_81140 [Streptomyces sp. TUS-ST3]